MEKKRIVIDVTGGVVQSVIHNIPDLEINVIDYDVYACDGNDNVKTISIPDSKPSEAYCYEGQVGEYDPILAKDISTQIQS